MDQSSGTVTIFDPNGVPRAVPAEQVNAAVQAGGKRAVKMSDPSGQMRWIPEDKVADAQKAGGKVAEEKSWLQGQKDQFDQAMAPEAGDSLGRFAMKRFIGGVLAPVVHPVDTAVGMAKLLKAGAAGINPEQHQEEIRSSPAGQMVQRTMDDYQQGGVTRAGTGVLADTAAAIISGKMLETVPDAVRVAPKVATAAVDAARNVPKRIVPAAARLIAGDHLDAPIPGDTATPRDLYTTAKDMGVNLDTAQATGSKVLAKAKLATEHSLGGGPKFDANRAANDNALMVHAEKILDAADPELMTREDFGNAAKQALQEHQAQLDTAAGEIYKRLDQTVGDSKPGTEGIQQLAQKIVQSEKGYFEKHPEFLKGGTGGAWKIVNSLAKAPEATVTEADQIARLQKDWGIADQATPSNTPMVDSWSDLHKLRSDLMDITRGPEIVGSRAEGWIKQLTGAVDNAMTDSSNLPASALKEFRQANELYSQMKQTYDDPQSKLYYVVRAQDGTAAANHLSTLTPALARKIAMAAPELVPQLQRQAIDRILRPAGNDVPDLQNLPRRWNKLQKEQLRGVLSPEQMQQVEDLTRVSRAVHSDSNPSGSAKKGQAVAEAAAMGSGALRAGAGLLSANPVAVAEGLAPAGWYGATRVAGKLMTSPKFTEAVINATKGPEGWANRGTARILEHVKSDGSSELTNDDLWALRATPAGKKLLVQASERKPGSAGMKTVVQKLAALKTQSAYKQGSDQ